MFDESNDSKSFSSCSRSMYRSHRLGIVDKLVSSVREALSESLTEGDVGFCGGAGSCSEAIRLLARCNVRKSREKWCGEIEVPWLTPMDIVDAAG